MKVNLDNKRFKVLGNSENGEVSNETIFHYRQEKNIIWASYSGGSITKGFLIGKMKEKSLIFSYQHINENLEIMTGNCKSRLEVTNHDKIKLFEEWEWTCRDFSNGSSILIEI